MTVKRAIRIYSLMIIPLAVQYTIVDGFTGMGIAKVAISLSTFRKLIYFAGVFLIPVWFDITNVFYTEPISRFDFGNGFRGGIHPVNWQNRRRNVIGKFLRFMETY